MMTTDIEIVRSQEFGTFYIYAGQDTFVAFLESISLTNISKNHTRFGIYKHSDSPHPKTSLTYKCTITSDVELGKFICTDESQDLTMQGDSFISVFSAWYEKTNN